MLVFPDSVMTVSAVRGRKPAPAKSRQQLQREKALQLAAQKNAGSRSPEQQLAKPPPKEPAQPPAPERTAQQEVKSSDRHQPAAEEENLAVKELERREVELLVSVTVPFTL